MAQFEAVHTKSVAHAVGWALIGSILLGIGTAFLIAHGIDVNMTADIAGTAEAMLGAETRLRAKAYLALLALFIQIFITIGFYALLRKQGQVLALWSLFVGFAASLMTALGAVFAMNAALIAGHSAFADMALAEQRLLMTELQATFDYTSFHLALIVGSLSNAGFFYLFLRSGFIPKLIAGWGVWASLFVAIAIALRDFVPLLGHNLVTAAFMVSNLVALIALGLYLGVKGVRVERSEAERSAE